MPTTGVARKGRAPLGDHAVANYVTALRAIYRVAREEGHVAACPFAVARGSMRMDCISERRIWSQAQLDALVSAARTVVRAEAGGHARGRRAPMVGDLEVERLARFLILTGCRPVEAMRLRAEDIRDLPRPAMLIRGKGKRRRWLPLRGELLDLVRPLAQDRTGFIFVPERVKRGWPQRRWEAVCVVAGVPSVAYDLRHTFITRRVAAGVPLALIAAWCGNTTRVIEERYAHLQPRHLDELSAPMPEEIVEALE